MATSFESIYALNLTIQNDKRLQSLSTNLYYYLLFQYLQYSIGEFTDVCWTSLDCTDFSQDIYQFTGDGVTNDYTLDSGLTGSFYVEVDDVEISSSGYNYNSTTGVITLSSTPLSNDAIYIANYIIGSFTQTLSRTEKTILSIGMTIPFIKSSLLKSKQLEQMISVNPVNITSQANHNKTLLSTLEFTENEFIRKMNRYSYKNDPDELEDIVGSEVDS